MTIVIPNAALAAYMCSNFMLSCSDRRSSRQQWQRRLATKACDRRWSRGFVQRYMWYRDDVS